jgi:phage terminase small subunit
MKSSNNQRQSSPEHLEPATRKWFESVCGEYELRQHHRHLLQLAAEAYDAVQLARATLARQGRYYPDRFGAPRLHPAVADERDARLGFARLVRQLGLDDDNDPSAFSSPPRTNSKKAVFYRGQ